MLILLRLVFSLLVMRWVGGFICVLTLFSLVWVCFRFNLFICLLFDYYYVLFDDLCVCIAVLVYVFTLT